MKAVNPSEWRFQCIWASKFEGKRAEVVLKRRFQQQLDFQYKNGGCTKTFSKDMALYVILSALTFLMIYDLKCTF